jgi:beta propeller repeat protein
VVWAHKANIYAYNLTTEQETRVTSVEASDAYPLVAGDLLVWLDYPGFWGYRLAAGDAEEFRITNFQALPTRITFGEQGRLLYERAFFALSDHVLVWSDAEAKDTYDILAYDLDRSERIRITDDGYNQTWPAAAGGFIVWADERNDEGDVYAYNVDTQEEFPIVTAPLTQTMPSTDGRHVVWIDGRDGNDDVYACDLETQTEFPVITGPGDRFLPGVWGDFVIWMEQDGDGVSVYGYDLRLDEKFAIATEGGWPADARIWDNVVVWTEYREEDKVRAIYGAILEY